MTTATQTVKERPILFSGEMVLAILDGRKTMTRRVVKARNICDECLQGDNAPNNYSDLVEADGKPNVAGAIFGTTPYLKTGFCEHNDVCGERIRCPYGRPGDRLWVREAFAFVNDDGDEWVDYRATPRFPGESEIRAAAWDNAPDDLEAIRWRPSIHMPRVASRITLEITNVRVERLNEISAEDAHAEGVRGKNFQFRDQPPDWIDIEAFHELWDKINGKKHPWSSNPWVWVIEFQKI